MFARFVEGHGHTIEPGAELTHRTGSLELDAFVFPRFPDDGPCWPQVDYAVSHPRLAKGRLLESFAGHGRTFRESLNDTIQKFERGTLHVLIATLLDPSACADQVAWERWSHPSGDFDACLGAQLLLYSRIDQAPMSSLLDSLRDALAAEPLDRTIHALRIFAARDGAKTVADEVLLDGEPWAAGLALLQRCAFPHHSPGWGTRLFAMLRPVEDGF